MGSKPLYLIPAAVTYASEAIQQEETPKAFASGRRTQRLAAFRADFQSGSFPVSSSTCFSEP